ncbi:unnamed protein product [Cochlearia groenlandica]
MCTLEKRGDLFILTLTGDNEHRFNPTTISSILSLLQQAKSQSSRDSVLITTIHDRFFSNGFDLAWAQSSGANQFLIGFAVKFFSDTVDIHPNRIRVEFGSSLKVRFCRWVLSKSRLGLGSDDGEGMNRKMYAWNLHGSTKL